MKKTTFIILGLLAFLSCGETVYRENNYMFQLPQKDVFVKTSFSLHRILYHLIIVKTLLNLEQ